MSYYPSKDGDPVTKKLRKPAPKTKTKKGLLCAVKAKRASKSIAWMPDEVVIKLTGERGGKLLIVCGWTMGGADLPRHVTIDEAWPVDRIEHNLGRLTEEWTQDFSKSWKLEIRPL